jgi:hypothetical protein
MVPSSTTVTPSAATRSPIRPEKAEVFLRLKSPSSPWPIASWSRIPGQPGPRTTPRCWRQGRLEIQSEAHGIVGIGFSPRRARSKALPPDSPPRGARPSSAITRTLSRPDGRRRRASRRPGDQDVAMLGDQARHHLLMGIGAARVSADLA